MFSKTLREHFPGCNCLQGKNLLLKKKLDPTMKVIKTFLSSVLPLMSLLQDPGQVTSPSRNPQIAHSPRLGPGRLSVQRPFAPPPHHFFFLLRLAIHQQAGDKSLVLLKVKLLKRDFSLLTQDSGVYFFFFFLQQNINNSKSNMDFSLIKSGHTHRVFNIHKSNFAL